MSIYKEQPITFAEGALARMPLVSVCVRLRNDRAYIRKTLEGILAQQGVPFEVLVCDDHSTDDSVAQMTEFAEKIRLVPPPDGAYVPAKTLNAFVAAAKGDLIVFNNSDAIPTHDRWLYELVKPLVDRTATVTFARQMARAEAVFTVQRDMALAYGPQRVSDRWEDFFSLVSAGFWKETLVQYPFDAAYQYSEDVAWIRAARQRGDARVLLVASAIVEHSHNYTLAELHKRYYSEGVAWGQMGGSRQSLCHGFLAALRLCAGDSLAALKVHCFWSVVGVSLAQRCVQRLAFVRGTMAGARLAKEVHV